MSLDPDAMPPLVRDFAEAVRYSPDDRAWLRLYGHTLIDSLTKPDGSSAAMVLEILRLMPKPVAGHADLAAVGPEQHVLIEVWPLLDRGFQPGSQGRWPGERDADAP